MNILDKLSDFITSTAFFQDGLGLSLIMIAIACVLLYLAIVKQFEPLLLLPIAFGMLLTNIPASGVYHPEFFQTQADGSVMAPL